MSEAISTTHTSLLVRPTFTTLHLHLHHWPSRPADLVPLSSPQVQLSRSSRACRLVLPRTKSVPRVGPKRHRQSLPSLNCHTRAVAAHRPRRTRPPAAKTTCAGPLTIETRIHLPASALLLSLSIPPSNSSNNPSLARGFDFGAQETRIRQFQLHFTFYHLHHYLLLRHLTMSVCLL